MVLGAFMAVEDAWRLVTGFRGMRRRGRADRQGGKIRPGKKVFLLVGILAFVISILVIFFLAQTPALL